MAFRSILLQQVVLFSRSNSLLLRNDRIDWQCLSASIDSPCLSASLDSPCLSASLDSLNRHRVESRCTLQVSVQYYHSLMQAFSIV